jgi:SRSO17 transposase
VTLLDSFKTRPAAHSVELMLDLAEFRSWLSSMIVWVHRVAGSRWHVEECFQQAKNEAELDHYQVRSWRAWYAHITLYVLALAWLAVTRAVATKGESEPATRA